ncbi:MAG: LLM class flavin-dependent oxidoreductase [Cyanobacteria bacterium P01_G01_bin.54]
MDFSLFYFSGNGSTTRRDKYRLLLEGAKFADRHGFSAVWIPERHFDAFGGLYPNPSVAGAAIAAVTEKIEIRSGSVVMPLQDPLRVAEEWAMVDNISNGRVSLSFAPGWHPNDFVLAPENYDNKKEIMWRGIEVVKELWRGGAIELKNGAGKLAKTQTFPNPLQKELRIWITSLSDASFIKAGEMGANVLASPLYQSVEDTLRKIKLYRDTLAKNGHDPQAGKVAMMVHTFIGDDINEIRKKVKEPFKNYLRTHFDLVAKPAADLFASIDPKMITPQDMEELLDFSFETYLDGKVLIGTPDYCQKLIDDLKQAGVDEVSALIDFGVEFDWVMESLQFLDGVKQKFSASSSREMLAV